MKRWMGPVGVGTVLVLSGLLVVGSYVQAKRTLAAKSDDLTRAYEVVSHAERHRLELLGELAGIIQPASPTEQGALAEMNAARSTVFASGTSQTLNGRASSALDRAVIRLLQIEDGRPEQRANVAYEDVASEVVTAQRDLYQDRRRYDRTLADYNIYLGQFPNDLWAQMAGYHTRGDYLEPGHNARLSEFEH